MIQVLCAKESAKVTFYVDEEEWPDIKTWWTRNDPDRHYQALGSDGEDLLLRHDTIIGIAHYPPDLWEEKLRQQKIQKIRQKRAQRGAGALTDEERQILREVQQGGGRQTPKSGPSGIIQ